MQAKEARRRHYHELETSEQRERRLQRNREYGRKYYRENRERIAAQQRALHYKKKFGLTLAELEAMGDRCEICGTEGVLAVDHDHTTGAIRGLLCHKCNTALGLLGDSVEGLEGAIRYLAGEQA